LGKFKKRCKCGERNPADSSKDVIELGWHNDQCGIVKGQPLERELRKRHADGCGQFIARMTEAVGRVPEVAANSPPFFHDLRKHMRHEFEERALKSIEFPVVEKACEQLGVPESLQTGYLRVLRALGYLLWVGDVHEMAGGVPSDAANKVFNPTWVRRPVYELIRENSMHTAGLMSAAQLKERLPTRIDGCPDADYVYQQHPFDDNDRSEIRILMGAARVGVLIGDGILLPDLLDDSYHHSSEMAGCKAEEVTVRELRLPFLTDRVFNRVIGRRYENVPERRSKHLTRYEIVFDHEYAMGKCRAMVQSFVCPADGSLPYLKIFLHADPDNDRLRDRLLEDIQETFLGIIADETGSTPAEVGRKVLELQTTGGSRASKLDWKGPPFPPFAELHALSEVDRIAELQAAKELFPLEKPVDESVWVVASKLEDKFGNKSGDKFRGRRSEGIGVDDMKPEVKSRSFEFGMDADGLIWRRASVNKIYYLRASLPDSVADKL
jgi:hypothetical protein